MYQEAFLSEYLGIATRTDNQISVYITFSSIKAFLFKKNAVSICEMYKASWGWMLDKPPQFDDCNIMGAKNNEYPELGIQPGASCTKVNGKWITYDCIGHPYCHYQSINANELLLLCNYLRARAFEVLIEKVKKLQLR